jgi:3-oxoadipate enol-lactonase
MPFADVNGTEVYYEVHGKGVPVLFAHGAGGNHLSWWQQVPVLQRYFQCVTFDHRGWGLTQDPEDLGPAAFADDLIGLADYLEFDEFLAVGQSMGGFTCLIAALSHPGRIKGLLMANTFAGMRREVWLASPEELRADAHAIWEKRRSTGIKRALAPQFTTDHKDRAFLYKQIRLINENGPNHLRAEGQIARLRALERVPEASATRKGLGELRIPVLFIGGEHDEIMPVPLMGVASSLIPASRMVVVPGAAHSVYFEAPEIFNHVALEFFRDCVGVTPD